MGPTKAGRPEPWRVAPLAQPIGPAPSPGLWPPGEGFIHSLNNRHNQHHPQRREIHMSQKIAYVTGGMGGIGTAICQRLFKEGFKVIAGCGPSRDHAKWIAEQEGARLRVPHLGRQRRRLAVDGRRVLERRSPSTADRRARQQRRHHPRPHVPQDDARGLAGRDRHQPEQHIQRHQTGRRAWSRRAGAGSSRSRRSTARRARPGQTNYSAARPVCTASRWRWRRNSRARA